MRPVRLAIWPESTQADIVTYIRIVPVGMQLEVCRVADFDGDLRVLGRNLIEDLRAAVVELVSIVVFTDVGDGFAEAAVHMQQDGLPWILCLELFEAGLPSTTADDLLIEDLKN